MTEPNPYIGTTEVARLLGKSPRTVHRLVRAGELQPAVIAPGGFKGTFLFRREDVEALIEATAMIAAALPSTALEPSR